MAITIYKYAYHVDWDTEGVGFVRRTSGGSGVNIDLSNYYTKTDLQISGLSQVHFDNITEAYHNNMLDIQGGLDTSSGDSSGIDAEYYHLDASTYYDIIGIDFQMSVEKDSVNIVSLVNDEDSPGNSKYYGTDSGGTKGFFDLPTDSGCLWEELSDGTLTPANSNIVDLYVLGDIQTDDNNTNTKLGVGALASVTDGCTNIAIGKDALASCTSSAGNIAIGEGALYTQTEETSEGTLANIGIGYHALYSNTSGLFNFALGIQALENLTTGSYNIGIGAIISPNLITGDNNTIIGFEALSTTNPSECIAIGNYSGGGTLGNTSVGYLAANYNNGSYNTAIGWDSGAGADVDDLFNYNIWIGYKAGACYYDSGGNVSVLHSIEGIYIGKETLASTDNTTNEIVIGNEAIGQGSNTAILGGIDNAATYLTGEIYCVVYDSDNVLSGSLPLADSDITQVVMYDPTTGKLYYGTGEGGEVAYTFSMSLNEVTGTVTLDNDEATPGNSKYYGTDAGGTKGFFDLPAGGEVLPFQTASFANPLEIDCTTYKDWICTVIGDCTVNLNNANDGDAGMLELIMEPSSSGGDLNITFGDMWTKKLGLVNLNTNDGEDNIISWRAIGDGSTQEIVYTIGQIEV